MMRKNVLLSITLMSLIHFALMSASVSALTILREYVAPGEQFKYVGGQITAGPSPTNTVGGGNLVDLFSSAADAWERSINDDHTVRVQFGWSPIPVGGGVHNVLLQGGDPNRVTDAIVYFDNDGSTKWFLDPTPRENSEYGAVTECFTILGAGRINSGRILSSGVRAARALDLLTIAKHEIGHAVGLSTWNVLWVSKNADQGIRIHIPRPFAGSVVPTNAEGHLALPGTLMEGALVRGQRKLLSVVDVLVIAEMGAFSDLNLESESAVMSSVNEGC